MLLHVAIALTLASPAPGIFQPARPPDPNPGADLPPLGCRHAFPPHAWCVEQASAAKAFADRCERLLLSGSLSPIERALWVDLQLAAGKRRDLWASLAEVQDPADGRDEMVRRMRLAELYDAVGPDAFHAGRMPPPVPPGAPVD